MKLLSALPVIMVLAACGPESSPEGRMTNKMEEIRQEFDSLKKQNDMILDSLGKLSEQIRSVREKK